MTERVIILMGDAGPLVEQARARVEATVRPTIGPAEFNYNRYRGGDPDALKAFEVARMAPMLAHTRLVELRGLDQAPAAVLEGLVAYIAAPVATTVLLATGATFGKVEKGGANWTARLKGALKTGNGRLTTYASEDTDPRRFAVEVATYFGKALSATDADRLINRIGTNLGVIEQEVIKLATFVMNAPRIDGQSIEAVCAPVAETEVWELTGGIVERDYNRALETVHRMLADGHNAQELLGAIGWQLRQILVVAELVRNGAPDGAIGGQVKGPREAVGRMVSRVRRHGFGGDSATVLRMLATANRNMHGGSKASEDRILEGFVLDLLGL